MKNYAFGQDPRFAQLTGISCTNRLQFVKEQRVQLAFKKTLAVFSNHQADFFKAFVEPFNSILRMFKGHDRSTGFHFYYCTSKLQQAFDKYTLYKAKQKLSESLIAVYLKQQSALTL